jgi:hypothetical protein
MSALMSAGSDNERVREGMAAIVRLKSNGLAVRGITAPPETEIPAGLDPTRPRINT